MIVLVRHAHTAGGEGRCIGRTSLSLSAKGEVQAASLALVFRKIQWGWLISSPAVRAQRTLSPLAHKLDLVVDQWDAFNEIDMGAWDGLSFDDIRLRYPREYEERGDTFGDFRPPDGESFNDVADRARSALDQLAGENRPACVLTHAGVIRSLICRFTGHPMDDLFHFKVTHTHCTLLNFSSGKWTVDGVNLPPEEALHHIH